MDELLIIVVVLAVVLGAITVIGHGIWLILATLVRLLFERHDEESPRHPDHCPHCGLPLRELHRKRTTAGPPSASVEPLAPGAVSSRLSNSEEPLAAEVLDDRHSARAWHDRVAGHMAAREIHWVEPVGVLLGGLIMVGSSIALIASLWHRLEALPYLKFAIFVGYTSLVFAAGLYARHRWRLRSTGDGLLVIAMLLVPLNFLAMASLWRGQPHPLTIASELLALGVFVWLIHQAGASLVPRGRWYLAVGTAGIAGAVLLVARLTGEWLPPDLLTWPALLPPLIFAGVVAGYLGATRQPASLGSRQAVALLTLAGTTTFGTLMALGLYVAEAAVRLGGLDAATDRLAMPAAIGAMAVMAVGVELRERIRRRPRLAVYRTVGTAIALMAVVIQIAALALAYPDAEQVMIVALLTAAGCFGLAVISRSLGDVLFAVGQVMVYVAAVAGVAAWFHFGDLPWHRPWSLQVYGVTLACASLGWETLRAVLHITAPSPPMASVGTAPSPPMASVGRTDAAEPADAPGAVISRLSDESHATTSVSPVQAGWKRWKALLVPRDGARGLGVNVDTAVALAVIVLHLVVVVAVTAPEFATERIWPSSTPSLGVLDVAHGLGWLLTALLAAVMLVPLRANFRVGHLVGLLLLALTAPWLVADHFAPEYPVEPPYRWAAAGMFLVTAATIWFRGSLAHVLAPTSLQKLKEFPVPLASLARGAMFLLLAMPVIGLTLAVELLPLDRLTFGDLSATADYCVPLAVIALALLGHGIRERSAGWAFPAGLVVNVILLVARDLPPRRWLWTLAPELAGMMLVAACIAWAMPWINRRWPWLDWLGIPSRENARPLTAFHVLQSLAAALVFVLAVWIPLDADNVNVGADTAWFGLIGWLAAPPTALMLLGVTIVMAAVAKHDSISIGGDGSPQTGDVERGWQCAAFAAGLLVNCAIGWATLDVTVGTPGQAAPWLHRGVTLLVGAAMLALVGAAGLRRFLPSATRWHGTGRDVAPAFGVLAAATLIAVFIGEISHFNPDTGTPLTVAAAIAVGVILAVLTIGSLAIAIIDNRNRKPADVPTDAIGGLGLGLSPQVFVYAAEAALALLVLHVYLCAPWLFRLEIIERYWMLIVMAVAFGGVGLGAWLEQRGLDVLAEPLRRTAEWLPLIVMVGFWWADRPNHSLALGGSTPLLWLLVAVFYGLIAARRESAALAGLSIFTASVGFWVVLDRGEIDFVTHPQLWLIPPGLVLLVAEQLDRRLLSTRQRTGVRYLALSMIYISSTTEFMREVGRSVWMPLVLLGLSAAGVLVGVWLRIRSYVYLGLAFLVVLIARMIAYAAFERGQMWLFWTCSIALGAAIIALFAVIERRRDELTAAVRQFRQWEE